MTTHRHRFWHLARALVGSSSALVEAHCTLASQQVFTPGVSRPFSSCFQPLAFLFFPAIFFGSSHIGSFHSPVHDGSVDVDEIDEDLKVEVALGNEDEDDDDRLRLVATK